MFDQRSLDQLAQRAPTWRAEQMKASMPTFLALDEPTGVEEDWRYVDYDMPFEGLVPPVTPGDSMEQGVFLGAIGGSAAAARIVDGFVIETGHGPLKRMSDVDDLMWTLPADHNKLAAAASSFTHDGLVLEVSDGEVLEQPLVVDVQGVTPNSASFPYLRIELGENSQASVVVVYRSAPGARLLMVPTVELAAGPGANLSFVSVQNLDHAAIQVVHQRVKLARDATSRLGEVGLGGKLGRLDLAVDLEGDGSSSEVVGLYFGEGEQTLDYRMVVNHSGKSTSSDIFLKGAVEDAAQSVFTGLLRIEKDAQKTSTFETNRNLVLSEDAKAHSVPNLEILCDDVVCGHGSSVGPLEEDHLYYLQSRGVRRERAERMLIRGFFTEVVDRLPVSGLAGAVTDEVFSRFVTAQEEGRVG